MGVLIEGMEMPKSCRRCDISQPDGCGFFCPIVVGKPIVDSLEHSRHVRCPLIPIPPHGRLGDLDRLEQMFVDIDNAPYSGFDGTEPFYSAEDAAQIIRLAPTVIPASESKERPAFLPQYELTLRSEEG